MTDDDYAIEVKKRCRINKEEINLNFKRKDLKFMRQDLIWEKYERIEILRDDHTVL
jgi:hypothetical protein